MSAIGPFAIPILAVGAFAATLGWFGYQHMTRMPAGSSHPVASETPRPASVEAPARPGAQEGGKPTQPATRTNAAGGAQTVTGGAETTPAAPAFDVVRVEPTGETVVAGRAAPGASVELVLDGVRHSRVVADPSGLFALVPEPLPPGSHELSLQVTNGDGSKVRSPQSVTVVVAANRKDAPLVTITAPGQPAVVLSRPDGGSSVAGSRPDPGRSDPGKADPSNPAGDGRPDTAPSGEGTKPVAETAPPAKTRRTVQIVSVETEGAGRLLVAGSAAPAAVVRLYLNDTFIAPASAGGDGRVSFSIERGMRPGSYKVRLDDVDPVSGQVRSRAEVPFDMPQQVASLTSPGETPPVAAAGADTGVPGDGAGRLASAGEPVPATAGGPTPAPDGTKPSPAVRVPEISTAVVSRGDSLWAISKRTYGHGLRYSVIYGANAKQIRDPNLIYPGQLFVLPTQTREGAAR